VTDRNKIASDAEMLTVAISVRSVTMAAIA